MNESSEFALFIGRFHPVLVHLPIGLLVLLAFMEGLSRWRRFEHANANAGIVLALAVPSSIAAAVCGWLLSSAGGYDERLLNLHFWTGVSTATATTLAGVLFLANQRALYRITVFAGFGVLLVASHFGGSLTHGSDYLFRYAPTPVRSWLRGAPKAPVLPEAPEVPESTSTSAPSSAAPSVYTDVAHPIFDSYCVSCHGPEKSKGGLRLDTYEALIKGGNDGPSIVAGKSAESDLVKRLLFPLDSDDHMPPDGKPQPSKDEVALLKWWIDAGAPQDQPVGTLKTTPKIAEILSKKLGTVTAQASARPQEEKVRTLDRAEAVAQAQTLSAELKVPVTALSESEAWLQCNASIAGREFKDEQLARLAPIGSNLRWLDLAGTAVSDAGLTNLSTMPNLTRLYLQRTEISDEGLKALENLAELEYLNLYGSHISDAGLETLSNLPKLRQLYLWQTQVTKSNAMAFAEARLDQDQLKAWEDEIETLKKRIKDAHVAVHMGVDPPPVAAPSASAGPINTLCPVSGKPIDKQRTSTFEGHVVAFCCADCKATFDKDPKPYLARLDLGGKPNTAEQKPINTECPVSGKAVDPAHTLVYEGKLIAFCCDDCKANFQKDPNPYLAKLHLGAKPDTAEQKPINTECPVSGKAVDPARTLVYEGKLIAFCCDDCKANFQKDPKPYLAKLNLGSKPDTAEQKPINTECPVSGEPVDPSRTILYEGKLVAFCCDTCKSKFEKDPAAFAAKLANKAAANKGALNAVCPVSGKPVDSVETAEYEGKTVAFCCADCKATFLKDPTPYLAKLNASPSDQPKSN